MAELTNGYSIVDIFGEEEDVFEIEMADFDDEMDLEEERYWNSKE